MKTLLALALIFLTTYIVHSQILYEDNFESYTVGSIIPQTSLVAYPSDGFFEVIQDVSSKRLRINAPGSLSKALTQWSTRVPGNDVIMVEFDYFTGPLSTTISNGGIVLYGGDEMLGMMMHYHSKVVFAADHYWGVPIDELPLGNGNESIVLPPNIWVHLIFSYNTITKEAKFSGPGFSKSFQNYFQWNQSNFIIEYLHLGNSSYYYYDNIKVTAVSEATLASHQPIAVESEIQLYPNPVRDILAVKTEDLIVEVYIYDIYGKRSSVTLYDGKIDVSQFPDGIYVIGLKTNKGFFSQKIIKSY